jgi:hypothetical protein
MGSGRIKEEIHPRMRASSTISLFSEQHELNRQPFSILFSVLAHISVVGLIFLGIATAPKIKPTKIAERYVVRHLDLDALESEMQRAREEVKPARTHTPVHAAPAAPKSVEAPPSALRMAIQAPQGKQTLIQPDIAKPAPLNVEIPVPKLVIWSGKPAPVKTIVAPPPAPPMVTDFKPSVLMPNDEPKLAEVPIPASALAVHTRPILTGTTAPIVVSGPKPTPPVPLTSVKSTAPPTPTAILSLSDHQMAKGPVNLPPVNSSAIQPSAGTLAAEKPQEQPGHGSQTDKPADKPAEKTVSKTVTQPDTAKAAAQPEPAKAIQGANAGSDHAIPGQKGVGLENYAHAAHITKPKEGQFGSVVVGSALQDRYPEMADLMGGKMSYSVYVPVGLPKNWVLEYSLPNAGEAGSSARLEAPWPYDIVRPNIAPGSIDADALMVHGYVNLEGRFEALTIAFPPQFAQAQFVLSKLNQWQFRPATQNGQNVKVEVLLIIPEIEE